MGDIDLSGLRNRLPGIPAWIFAGLSFLLPFLFCLYYGRIGFNPLDSPIIFDGGYRILQGQDYLIDFFSPAGYIPSLIQSFFFRIFGVNWFAFCLHAALFNGLFSLLVFQLLRKLAAPVLLATFYALLSGLVFYAPFGSPYPEQHSFFFSLLGCFLLVSGSGIFNKGNGKAIVERKGLKSLFSQIANQKGLGLYFVGPSFLMALLSKPVPAAYLIILTLILVPFFISRSQWKGMLLKLFIGSLAAIGLMVLILEIWEMDLARAWYHFWELPAQTGLDRIAQDQAIPVQDSLFTRPFKVFASYNDPYVLFCYALPGILIIWGLVNLLVVRNPSYRISSILNRPWLHSFQLPSSRLFSLLALGTGLTLASGLFIRLTLNQEENGIPFIFLHLGLAHLFLLQYLKRISSNHPGKIRITRGILWGLSLILFFFVLKDAVEFHQETIVQRKVHDFPAEQEIPYSGPVGTQAMDWLLWQEPWRYGDRKMDSLIHHLKETEESFFYFGDMTFLYGLMDQPSPMPSLWLHEGLTIPPKDGKWFREFEDQLLVNLSSLDPGILIAENPGYETYTGYTLADLPKVEAWLGARKGKGYQLGLFHLWELIRTTNVE